MKTEVCKTHRRVFNRESNPPTQFDNKSHAEMT